MANEIVITSKIAATKGGSSVTNYTSSFNVDMASTATAKSQVDQIVGTAAEAITTGDVSLTAHYWLWFCNHNETNSVNVEVHKDGSNMAVAGIMLPGESFGPVRALAQATVPFGSGYPCYKLAASASTCLVEVIAVEAGVPD